MGTKDMSVWSKDMSVRTKDMSVRHRGLRLTLSNHDVSDVNRRLSLPTNMGCIRRPSCSKEPPISPSNKYQPTRDRLTIYDASNQDEMLGFQSINSVVSSRISSSQQHQWTSNQQQYEQWSQKQQHYDPWCSNQEQTSCSTLDSPISSLPFIHMSKPRKQVRFSENVETLVPLSSYYPTPRNNGPIQRQGSSRRYSIHDIELYFSEDTLFPPSKDDYIISRFTNHQAPMLCGKIYCRHSKMVLPMWRTYWAELYNGVLMLYKAASNESKRKRELIPVFASKLIVVDAHAKLFNLEYTSYEGVREIRSFKLFTKLDLFVWWWALQLSSVAHVDSRLLQTSMRKQEIVQITRFPMNCTETVLFPSTINQSELGRKSLGSKRTIITHLILVRHGETEYLHFRVPDKDKRLTERGREQALQTAKVIGEYLRTANVQPEDVTMVFGGLRRTLETAMEFDRVMPWLQNKYECCALEEGAPVDIGDHDRQIFRSAMHRIAHEYVCQHTTEDYRQLPASSMNSQVLEKYKILICHASFIQYLITKSTQDVKMGKSIGYASITRINVIEHEGQPDCLEPLSLNSVVHLPQALRINDE